MSVLFIVLPLALVLAGIALWAFIYSARRGQFDDLDSPPIRMLFDDEPESRPKR
jgi:cbb3-type cytochrome oxidase maturation protein